MAGSMLMGIDVGTYSSKGVICTLDGIICAEHQVEHGLSVPHPGWAEHDPDAVWWSDVCEISRALMYKAGVQGEDVGALAVSALGADLVLLNEHGRTLRPAILYGIDVRSIKEIEDLNARFGAEVMAQVAGQHLTSQAMGPKLLWVRNNELQVFEQTKFICSGSSFLVYRLTGEYVLDYHSAGLFSPLFDLNKMDWSDRFSQPILGDKRMPRLAQMDEVVGEVTGHAASETGLKIGTPVTAGTIDAISEAISVGVLHPGDLMMMYGTTTFFILVKDKVVPPNEVLWQTPFAFPGLYDFEAGMATTGALTRWFRDNYAQDLLASEKAGGPNAYARLTTEASTVPPGSEGLVVLPYFSGERTPLNDPEARGLVAGLSLTHTRGHLYRAILEATAYGTAHNMETMHAAGAQVNRAVAVGGGAKSDLLLQIVSDVTGIEQLVPTKTIGASYGDSFIAGLATGVLTISDLESTWVQIARHVTSDPVRHEIYKEYYRIYRELYPRTCKEMHALARLAARTQIIEGD
jgi:xylulokinase